MGSYTTECIITPCACACARGKAIGSDIVMDTKITKSWDLGNWANCNRNESVDFGEKLASVYLELSGRAYKHHKIYSVFLLAIVATPIDRAPLCMCFLLIDHAHDWPRTCGPRQHQMHGCNYFQRNLWPRGEFCM